MTHDIPNDGVSAESGVGNHDENLTTDRPSDDNRPSLLAFIARRRIGVVLASVLILATLGFFGMRAGAKPEKTGKNADKRSQVTPVTVAAVTQKQCPSSYRRSATCRQKIPFR